LSVSRPNACAYLEMNIDTQHSEQTLKDQKLVDAEEFQRSLEEKLRLSPALERKISTPNLRVPPIIVLNEDFSKKKLANVQAMQTQDSQETEVASKVAKEKGSNPILHLSPQKKRRMSLPSSITVSKPNSPSSSNQNHHNIVISKVQSGSTTKKQTLVDESLSVLPPPPPPIVHCDLPSLEAIQNTPCPILPPPTPPPVNNSPMTPTDVLQIRQTIPPPVSIHYEEKFSSTSSSLPPLSTQHNDTPQNRQHSDQLPRRHSSEESEPPRPKTPNPHRHLRTMRDKLLKGAELQSLTTGQTETRRPRRFSLPFAFSPPPTQYSSQPKRISFLVRDEVFCFRSVANSSADSSTQYLYLIISRVGGRPSNFDQTKAKDIAPDSAWRTAYAILGIIKIGKLYFLILVTDAEVAGSILGAAIYRVLKVEFFPFDVTWKPNNPNDKPIYYKVQKFCESGLCYFSYDYPITLNRQKQYLLAEALHSKPHWMTADINFFWNRHLVRHLIDNNCSDWIIPVTRGYFGFMTQQTGADKSSQKAPDITFVLILISRIGCLHAGTRYKTRGINDEGYVANYVETEQLCVIRDTVYSHVQIRGSVPVFWQEKLDKPHLTRTTEAGVPAFKKHIDLLIKQWKRVYLINLLSKKKKEEESLAAEYERQLILYKGLDQKIIKYVSFDYNAICEKKSKNVCQLIDEISESIKDFGWYSERGDRRTFQSGVFRTNCFDCLERTNIVQSEIALEVLKLQLQDWKMQSNNTATVDAESLRAYDWKSFRHIWNLNGETMERSYHGTGALKRRQKKEKPPDSTDEENDQLQNIRRFASLQFLKQKRYNGIDLFLGRTSDSVDDPMDSWIESQLEERAAEFQMIERKRIMIGSWNLNARDPHGVNLTLWCHSHGQIDSDTIDMYVFGFQEIVKLKPEQVINTDTTNGKAWAETLLFQLNAQRQRKVILLRHEQMVGVMVCVFVAKDQVDLIRNLQFQRSGVGIGGHGSKGALCLHLKYRDSSFCFICAHLVAGQSKTEERIKNYKMITKHLNKCLNASASDYIFWFGDLNFRIDLPRTEVEKKIQEKQWDYLYEYDQLQQAKSQRRIFKNYNEGKLDFAPTYKYDLNTNAYDTSEKKRCPAWTDRILWRSRWDDARGPKVSLELFNRSEIAISDHRPIKAIFSVEVKTIDYEKLNAIRWELMNSFSSDTKIESFSTSIASAPQTIDNKLLAMKTICREDIEKYLEEITRRGPALQSATGNKINFMTQFTSLTAIFNILLKYLLNRNSDPITYHQTNECIKTLQENLEDFGTLISSIVHRT